jgi:EAL domain-containing protein (putative c-di-GMP-specific phosphodiesterase class I)
MQVVAEGVEENEQITRLISMGCEFGQGFFFSRPVSAQDAERLMADMTDSAVIVPPGLELAHLQPPDLEGGR